MFIPNDSVRIIRSRWLPSQQFDRNTEPFCSFSGVLEYLHLNRSTSSQKASNRA